MGSVTEVLSWGGSGRTLNSRSLGIIIGICQPLCRGNRSVCCLVALVPLLHHEVQILLIRLGEL